MKYLFPPFFLVTIILLMLSCNDRKPLPTLAYADSIMESAPDSAYHILNSLSDSVEQFDTEDRMMYYTLLGDACNKLYKPLPSDTILNKLVDYYDSYGSANQQMKSRYLLGCYYRDNNDAPEALKHYQEAVECADTLDSECDFVTLFSIYGQMAFIYREHFLWDEEIAAWHNYSHFASRSNDKYNEIRGIEFLIHPYYYMNDSAKVVQLADSCHKLYKANGMDCAAASVLYIPIYYQIKESNYDKASNLMSVYETQSGLFDQNGNIAKGYEKYYYIKGMYYTQIHELDSAEHFFRKIANHGIDYYSYKGLLDIYRIKMIQDSIGKYSDLLENSLDDLLSQKATDAVVKSESLFNYNRANKIAEQKKVEAEKTKRVIVIILLTCLVIALFSYIQFFRYKKKRQEKMDMIYNNYSTLKHRLELSKQEVLSMNENMENLKKSKTEEIMRLKELISYYETIKGNNKDVESNLAKLENMVDSLMKSLSTNQEFNKKLIDNKKDEIDILQTKINALETIFADIIKQRNNAAMEEDEMVNTLHQMASGIQRPTVLREKEYKILLSNFRLCFPALYNRMAVCCSKNSQEERTCVLTRLNFSSKEIAVLLNTSAQRVSNIKCNLNKKLFGIDDAKTLFDNLINI